MAACDRRGSPTIASGIAPRGDKGAEAWLVDAAKATKVPCDLEPCKASAPSTNGIDVPAGRSPRPTASKPRSSATGISGCATSRTSKEVQLTRDGVKDFGYATDNAGWTTKRSSDRALVAGLEEDRHVPAGRTRRRRDVSRRHRRRPSQTCRRGSIRCPATRRSPVIHRVVDRRRDGDGRPLQNAARSPSLVAVRRHRVPRQRVDRRRSGTTTSSTVAFVSTSRDHRREQLRVADAATGDGPGRPGGVGQHVLRIRKRSGQLALPARVERGDLVFGARELGTSLSATI